MSNELPGAIVDCTILVVALVAAKFGMIPEMVLVALLCSIGSARVALLKRGPTPPGQGGILSSSAALALVVGFTALAGHFFAAKGHSHA